MLPADVFRNSQSRILYVHLYQDFAVSFMVAPVNIDSTVHIWGYGDLAAGTKLKVRVDTTYVFTTDQCHPADGSANGEMLSVPTGYLCRTQSTGEDRSLHLDFDIPSIFSLGVYLC